MEMRHRCKLCHRSFSNGRALGGHMKAHLATLPLPPKPPRLSDEEQLEEEDQLEKAIASYGLRENPKKSSRFADPEFSSGSVIQDRESETESKNQNPTRRRSKRSRRPNSATPTSPTASSSVSDTCPEVDVAMCLMMLSRDVWNTRECISKSSISVSTKKKRGCSSSSSSRRASKNRCELCNKVFRSYQAMCGHTKVCSYSSRRRKQTLEEEGDSEKVFECPYCDKVFGSGQALGGHKRSHQLNNNNTPPRYSLKNQLIDLNLPPPMGIEYDHDAFSVLSDA